MPVNQSVFSALAEQGWMVDLVVPDRWRHEYADGTISPVQLPSLRATFRPKPVALPGEPQRHFYRPGTPSKALEELRPSVAFLEEESFSVPAFQWAFACHRRGIPFGVQSAENLDRQLPLVARVFRWWTLRHATFVAARSAKAKEFAEDWGARGRVELVPHAVPEWNPVMSPKRSSSFTVGFAGRLVEEKGIRDLVAAVQRLEGSVTLLLVGNGPLREELSATTADEPTLEVIADASHEEMSQLFARMDVLVLPSRTTPTWTEQFGRVLVEALWCGVPVVGSDSGEIPWVIDVTGGGMTFPEGDIGALSQRLKQLQRDPDLRVQLAENGRSVVKRLFSVEAVAQKLSDLLNDVVNREATGVTLTSAPQTGAAKRL